MPEPSPSDRLPAALPTSEGDRRVLLIGRLDDGSQKAGLVRAQVRYALPTPEEKWIMGCAFLEELGEEELLAWLREQG